MKSGPDDPTEPNLRQPLGPPRDLVDFHLRWREFRPKAEEAARHFSPGSDARETITWLINLADRIGARDITE